MVTSPIVIYGYNQSEKSLSILRPEKTPTQKELSLFSHLLDRFEHSNSDPKILLDLFRAVRFVY